VNSIATRFALALFCVSSAHAFPQTRAQAKPCTLKGSQYTCDRPSFEQVFKASPCVSVKAPGLDPSSLTQMEKLANTLGKPLRSGSDLTLVLARSGSTGIYYGPSDRELATIRAYYGAPARLLWVESYYGQPGTPWPIVVNRLTHQFRDNFRH
jgi:hypothetical protein